MRRNLSSTSSLSKGSCDHGDRVPRGGGARISQSVEEDEDISPISFHHRRRAVPPSRHPTITRSKKHHNIFSFTTSSASPPRRLRQAARENALLVFQRINASPVRLFPSSLQECICKAGGLRNEEVKKKNIAMRIAERSVEKEQREVVEGMDNGNLGLSAGEVLVVSSGGNRIFSGDMRNHHDHLLNCGDPRGVTGNGQEQHPLPPPRLLEQEGGEEIKNVREISSHDVQWVEKVAGYHLGHGGELFIIHTPSTPFLSFQRLMQASGVKGSFSSFSSSPSFSETRKKGAQQEEEESPFILSTPLDSASSHVKEEEVKREKKELFLSLFYQDHDSPHSSNRMSDDFSTLSDRASHIHMSELKDWSCWLSFCDTAFDYFVEDVEKKEDKYKKKHNRDEDDGEDSCTSSSGATPRCGEGPTNATTATTSVAGSAAATTKMRKTPLQRNSGDTQWQRRETCCSFPFSSSIQKGEEHTSTIEGKHIGPSLEDRIPPPQSPLPHESNTRLPTSTKYISSYHKAKVSLLIITLHMGYLLEYERFTGKEVIFIPPLLSLLSRLKNAALIIMEHGAEGVGLERGVKHIPMSGGASFLFSGGPLSIPARGQGSFRHAKDMDERVSCNITSPLDAEEGNKKENEDGGDEEEGVKGKEMKDNQSGKDATRIDQSPHPPAPASPPRSLPLPPSLSLSTLERLSFNTTTSTSNSSSTTTNTSSSLFPPFETTGKPISNSSCSSSILSRFLLFLESTSTAIHAIEIRDRAYRTPWMLSSSSSSCGSSSFPFSAITPPFSPGCTAANSRRGCGRSTDIGTGARSIRALWYLQLESYFTSLLSSSALSSLPYQGHEGNGFHCTGINSNDSNKMTMGVAVRGMGASRATGRDTGCISFPLNESEAFIPPSGEKRITMKSMSTEKHKQKMFRELENEKEKETKRYNERDDPSLLQIKNVAVVARPITRGLLFKIISKWDRHVTLKASISEDGDLWERFHTHENPHSWPDPTRIMTYEGQMKRRRIERQEENDGRECYSSETRSNPALSRVTTSRPVLPRCSSSTRDHMFAVFIGVVPNILH